MIFKILLCIRRDFCFLLSEQLAVIEAQLEHEAWGI